MLPTHESPPSGRRPNPNERADLRTNDLLRPSGDSGLGRESPMDDISALLTPWLDRVLGTCDSIPPRSCQNRAARARP